MLTDQQKLHFETFGFLVRKQLFTPEEMAVVSQQFDEVLEQDRQGREFPGEKRQGVMGFVEQRPELSKLVEDDRIFEALEDLLGREFVWIGSDGNLYVGDTHWHPDASNSYPRIKVAFYLDPVEKDSGCLRVIPGSHRATLHDRLKEQHPTDEANESPYGVPGSEIPAFPLESKPGDVVFFNQNLWHSSWGGRTGRRMFTLNVGGKPTSEEQYEYLRQMHETNRSKFIKTMQFTQTDRVYTDSFLQSESPRIRGMVAELVKLGLK
ncbi:phytanoyl-CoA dioxygenase family protein [Tenggerimyces flavus]|uniref:Phytanoyl-CoA dioxygenase family protein n=1 Tax=Tenggerimyces flavus TaxID=1708749 RepID=A0ABV7YL65_9ACTN|nr:phytanoyl-CoA dioxygenase family protein [Tenggerimyces flavus]MBM7789632.1 ectoine hydroxylase-related dioxygenase (phytanoyl-CoA dioxygenase family) [Tenggerimyces flavus]